MVQLSPEAAYMLLHQPQHGDVVLEPARQAAIAVLDGVLTKQDMNAFSEASATIMLQLDANQKKLWCDCGYRMVSATGHDYLQAAQLYRLLMLHVEVEDRQPFWSQLHGHMGADALRCSTSASASHAQC